MSAIAPMASFSIVTNLCLALIVYHGHAWSVNYIIIRVRSLLIIKDLLAYLRRVSRQPCHTATVWT